MRRMDRVILLWEIWAKDIAIVCHWLNSEFICFSIPPGLAEVRESGDGEETVGFNSLEATDCGRSRTDESAQKGNDLKRL